jgi:hypothetical protein
MNGLTILVTAATGTERTGDAAPRPARSVITAATSRALTMQSSLDGSAAAPATSCSPLTSPVSVRVLRRRDHRRRQRLAGPVLGEHGEMNT